MKRRVPFWLALITLSMLLTPVFAQFAGGSGTQDDPWQVATAEHLNNLRNYIGWDHHDKHFIQTADIDLGVPPWNQGEGWEPIGSNIPDDNWTSNLFRAMYNGNGHVISGLYINRPNDNYQGLFVCLDGADIQNLELQDINVTGNKWVGGLAATIRNSVIRNCHVSGEVIGMESLIGLMMGTGSFFTDADGELTDCSSSGTVSGGSCVGGLVGTIRYVRVSNCHSSATVSGKFIIGGFAGYADGIENCHSTGDVTGYSNVGGLVGQGTQIYHCRSSATVNGYSSVGGLVGSGEIIEHCQSSGYVQGYSCVGGLLGYGGKIRHCSSSTTVEGNDAVGGLAGVAFEYVDYSHSTGDVSGGDYMGGLVGINHEYIRYCYSTGNVSGSQFVGGLVGINFCNCSTSNPNIRYSHSTGDVSGNICVGGLVGRNEKIMFNCYSSGEVVGVEKVGGLVGENLDLVQNCYSSGNVNGHESVGGLVGNNENSIVKDSYSLGSVTGVADFGGLVGKTTNGSVINSYWNLDSSGQNSSSGGEGRFTHQMVFPHSDDTYVGWDWDYWGQDADYSQNNGYPYLKEIWEGQVENQDLVSPIPENRISVFPQPAFTAPRVSIKSESPGKLSYTIYNVRGQKLYSAEIYSHDKEQSFELPLEAWKQLSNGVYLLSLERDKHRIATSRMVVVK